MTFGRWLLAQAHRDDPIGDLARDLAAGCHCDTCADPDRDPTVWRIADVVRDLDAHGADEVLYELLDRAAAEWNPGAAGPGSQGHARTRAGGTS